MINEEEQELVATKLMGWHWRPNKGCPAKKDKHGRWNPTRWAPETERIFWPEIWEKMDADLFGEYYTELSGLIIHNNQRGMHTAKPKDCWKALVLAVRSLY